MRYTEMTMIRQIRGQVVAAESQNIVIEVSGVGYKIFTPRPDADFTIGDEALVHTHLAVRENALDLYGFLELDELGLFELLITLPKIGPKTALQFLTQADGEIIRKAVVNEDATYLSKMSGIGKKSAEKIVDGLKGKLEPIASDFSGGDNPINKIYINDSIDALIALGYPQPAVREAVQKVTQKEPEAANSAEVVKAALKLLNQ